MADFRSIIERWPSPEDLATDTGAKLPAVRKWHLRNRVPSEYFDPMLSAAKRRQISLTAAEIVAAARRDS